MTTKIVAADVERLARQMFAKLEAEAPSLNRLDAESGDGDMGSTLAAIGAALAADAAPFPDDLGAAFDRLGRIIGRTSGSSLSAVLMVGLMRASIATKGKEEIAVAELSPLLKDVLAVMQQRSRANFGDKTILDAVNAIVDATTNQTDSAGFGRATLAAAKSARESFTQMPSKIGRARLSADNGKGLVDPGMVALEVALGAVIAD